MFSRSAQSIVRRCCTATHPNLAAAGFRFFPKRFNSSSSILTEKEQEILDKMSDELDFDDSFVVYPIEKRGYVDQEEFRQRMQLKSEALMRKKNLVKELDESDAMVKRKTDLLKKLEELEKRVKADQRGKRI